MGEEGYPPCPWPDLNGISVKERSSLGRRRQKRRYLSGGEIF